MTPRPDYDAVHKILRRPFPDSAIGKLPKPTRKDAPKGRCDECGGWHGLPAVHLDYVGHAAVRDRLLEADPTWTWHPYAVDEQGLPRIVVKGGTAVMWITLRVAGMERPGVGTAPADSFEVEKQLIGDALRNAALSFGVAIDLWAKEELEGARVETQERPQEKTAKRSRKATTEVAAEVEARVEGAVEEAKQRGTARRLAVVLAQQRVLDLVDGDKKRARVLWDEAVRTLGVLEAAMTPEQADAAAVLAVDTMLDSPPELEVTHGTQVPLPEGEVLDV
jgi:hypothetical protein